MTERSRPPFTLRAMRIGRTDLGAGSVAIDDDALVLVLAGPPDDRPVRVPLATVDAVSIELDEVALVTTDGSRLRLVPIGAEGTRELRDEIVHRCRTIPELTRALRALGSRRGHGSARASGPGEQQRFFAPLLDARRVAVAAPSPAVAFEAFDAAALARAIETTIGTFAAERHGQNAPARRALEAELVDLTEPLRTELAELGQLARDAESELTDLRRWRVWSAQLRRTFEIADRVWLTVDMALDSVPWRA